VNADLNAADAVPGLDATAALRWRRLPRTSSPWLHEEVAGRMADRLQWFRDPPASWLHWEPVIGGLQTHRRLCEQLPDARCHVWSDRLTQALDATGDPVRLGWNPLTWRRARQASVLPDGDQVGMLWANMQLHLESHPQALLRRWHGLIGTQGFLMFSCLGPDSLRELRPVFDRMGWPAPAHPFTDMHDWGDMLVHSGFAEPVMDMERIGLSYSSAEALLAELRGLGRNLSQQRFAALRGRGWRQRLLQALEQTLPRDADGRLLLGFEIIYGHAYKPLPRVPVTASQVVAVDDLRTMLRAGRR